VTPESAGKLGRCRSGALMVPVLARGNPGLRRAVPIAAYVGSNGGGKSLAMAFDSALSLDAGRPVASTMRFLDFRNPRPCTDRRCQWPEHGSPDHLAAHPLWIPLTDLRDIFDLRDCDVVLDEVQGVADSRAAMSMPVQFKNLLLQLRRRDVVLRWSTPDFSFADVAIRRVTQAVTICQGYMPVERPGSMWRDRRLFLWRTYDARDLDAFDAGKTDDLKPMVRQWFWRPGSIAESAYSTMSAVATMGVIDQAGMCLDCGGKRSHPRCSCDRDEPEARSAGSHAGP